MCAPVGPVLTLWWQRHRNGKLGACDSFSGLDGFVTVGSESMFTIYIMRGGSDATFLQRSFGLQARGAFA